MQSKGATSSNSSANPCPPVAKGASQCQPVPARVPAHANLCTMARTAGGREGCQRWRGTLATRTHARTHVYVRTRTHAHTHRRWRRRRPSWPASATRWPHARRCAALWFQLKGNAQCLVPETNVSRGQWAGTRGVALAAHAMHHVRRSSSSKSLHAMDTASCCCDL